jgi:hypothetical protein
VRSPSVQPKNSQVNSFLLSKSSSTFPKAQANKKNRRMAREGITRLRNIRSLPLLSQTPLFQCCPLLETHPLSEHACSLMTTTETRLAPRFGAIDDVWSIDFQANIQRRHHQDEKRKMRPATSLYIRDPANAGKS